MENNKKKEQPSTQFDYINQKPKVSRGQCIILGIAAAAIIGGIAILFVLTGSLVDYLSRPAFGKAPTQEALSENKPVEITRKDDSGANEFFSDISCTTNNATSSDRTHTYNDNQPTPSGEPVYAEVYTEFTLYEGALSDNIVLEPVSSYDYTDGCYVLEPGKAYTVYWGAAPLFSNEDGEVDATVDVHSDAFQIEEGATGNITIKLRDHAGRVNYWDVLGLASVSGDLSIEFCADECRFAYGGEPTIENYGYVPELATSKMRFALSFYTSGEYVESKSSSGIYGTFGEYSYECSVDNRTAEVYDVEPTCDPIPMPPANDHVEHSAQPDHPSEQQP